MLDGGNGAAHPVSFEVEPVYEDRRRLTGALRLLVAVPHLVFTGGPSLLGIVVALLLLLAGLAPLTIPLSIGAFGVITALTTIASWFAILILGRQPRDLREFAVFFLSWRAKTIAYTLLLRDEFPSFGFGDYPATLTLPPPLPTRDRLSVAFRLPLLAPHIVALALVNAGLTVVSMAGWLGVVLFRWYPQPLYDLAAAAVRYSLRVEAYLLLIHDEYPPFRLHQ